MKVAKKESHQLNKEDLKKKYELESKFYRQMFELDLYNKFNKTFIINLTEKTDYGWKGYLQIEFGLSFKQLETDKVINSLNENLQCIFKITTTKISDKAQLKIIDTRCNPKIPYENPNVKPYEIFIGMNLEWQPIKINAEKHCHILIAGSTGSGKTRGLHCSIVSSIIGCQPNEVELYLCDLFADEFVIYKKCKHVRYYANEISQLHKMLNYIFDKLNKRIKVISPLKEDGVCADVSEYNQKFKNKMTAVYIYIDEFSLIMPTKSDKKELKEMKEECIDLLDKIAKLARKNEVFLIMGLQKTVRDEIPPIIKSSCATRICYRVNDSITSEVILETHEAVGLDPRYAIYHIDGNNISDFLFTPCIEIPQIKELIKHCVDKNHSMINLDALVEAKVEPISQKRKSEKSTYSQKKKIEHSNNPIIYDSQIEGDDYIDR